LTFPNPFGTKVSVLNLNLDHIMMTDQDCLNDIAQSLGYTGAKPQPTLSGRGRPALSIERLLLDLFESGFQYDRNYMEGTATPEYVPFIGDPHPDFPRVNKYLLRLDPNGQPVWESRAEFIRYVRQMTRRLNRPISQKAAAKKLAEETRKQRIEESLAHWRAEVELLEARRAKLVASMPSAISMKRLEAEHQIRKADLRISTLKSKIELRLLRPTTAAYSSTRKVELRRAKRVVQTGKPAKLPDGQFLEPEDARWVLDNVKQGRPLDNQPSKQALYMRKYREKKKQVDAIK